LFLSVKNKVIYLLTLKVKGLYRIVISEDKESRFLMIGNKTQTT